MTPLPAQSNYATNSGTVIRDEDVTWAPPKIINVFKILTLGFSSSYAYTLVIRLSWFCKIAIV